MMEKPVIVIKRDGRVQNFTVQKIEQRIRFACFNLDLGFINPITVTEKTAEYVYDTMFTREIDTVAAREAAKLGFFHPDYYTLAKRIEVANLHKQTKRLSFSEVTFLLYKNCTDPKQKLSETYYQTVINNKSALNDAICYENDFNFDYFALRILEQEFLFRNTKNEIIECPQYMLLRVAIAINLDDIPAAIETYKLMSSKYFLPSIATLKSAGTVKSIQSPSYALVTGNTLENLFSILNLNVCISSLNGRTSIALHNIPAKNTNRKPVQYGGIATVLQLLNKSVSNTCGVLSVYLEPWHADICDFLKEIVNSNKKLTYVIWMPNLFMKRLETNEPWSLMCPEDCPNLSASYGLRFEALYKKYEKEGKIIRSVDVKVLWNSINMTQTITGQPLIVFKDSCNLKSNQNHTGIIQSLNYDMSVAAATSAKTPSCCNHIIIALNQFVSTSNNNNTGSFDYEKLREVVKVIVRNLNKCIDKGVYPSPRAKSASLFNRAIVIGVSGLAETFALLTLPYEHKQSREINIRIFETIYYSALEESCALAEIHGPYTGFQNSTLSKGLFQFNINLHWEKNTKKTTWDWVALREKILKVGVRNSLLVGLPSTPLVSHLLGNTERTEPFLSSVYNVDLYGEVFAVINPYLAQDLIKSRLWTEECVNDLLDSKGCIQPLAWMPSYYKDMYRLAWEVSTKFLLAMAVERAHFIDNCEPLTLYLAKNTPSAISSNIVCCWKLGLKTGMCNLKPFKGSIPIKLVEEPIHDIVNNKKKNMLKINLSDLYTST